MTIDFIFSFPFRNKYLSSGSGLLEAYPSVYKSAVVEPLHDFCGIHVSLIISSGG